jgi:hypothetical protein
VLEREKKRFFLDDFVFSACLSVWTKYKFLLHIVLFSILLYNNKLANNAPSTTAEIYRLTKNPANAQDLQHILAKKFC